jgi:hypothetical protein
MTMLPGWGDGFAVESVDRYTKGLQQPTSWREEGKTQADVVDKARAHDAFRTAVRLANTEGRHAEADALERAHGAARRGPK